MPRVVAVALLATVSIAAPNQSSSSSHSNGSSQVGTSPPASTARKSGSPHSASLRPVSTGAHSNTHSASRRSRKKSHSTPGPSYQLHPDPDRYRQIQQALTDRGYFKGTVNGEWNADSVDALKRFQSDQQLESDGKINALTLNGLGLGAKHDGSSAATVPLSATSSGTAPDPAPAPSELPAETPPPLL